MQKIVESGRVMQSGHGWTGLRKASLALMAGLLVHPVAGQTAISVPFVTNVAGVAPGGTTTACATTVDIPTFNVSPGPFHYGDGCVASQATLSAPYSVTADSLGNLYISDYNHYALRVVYNGGAALSAAIVAANPNVANLVPQQGYVYTIVGGTREGTIAKTGSPAAYYCNSAGTGPQTAAPLVGYTDGNGCPGTEAYIKPRLAAVDQYGNVFFPNISGGTSIRVFYVGGAKVAALISAENGGSVVAQPGYVYVVAGSGSAGDGDNILASLGGFNALRSVAVDSNGNLFVADSGNNDVRRIDGTTGIMTTIAGGNNCGTTGCTAAAVGVDGDGGLAVNATFTGPYAVFVDGSNNVYVADQTNARLRVIYMGSGSLPGVTNPQTGYIYSVAGGGATSAAVTSASGTVATQLAFGTVQTGGMDGSGNIYLVDGTSKFVWRVDAKAGTATIIGGLGLLALPATSGSYCSGTSGPKSVDTNADGCPATEAGLSGSGLVTFDSQGNFYISESTNAAVRKFSYNTQFPPTGVGSSTAQAVAFSVVSPLTATGETFKLQSGTDGEFSDAGGDTCLLQTAIPAGTTCVFNIAFSPTLAGLREGSVTFPGTPIGMYLGGVGKAANVSIDSGTQTTIGTGLKPSGIATDLLGNLYISDATSNKVMQVAVAGGTPVALISGLNSPAQIAVDGKGNLYVADKGNNRVAMTGSTGGTITTLGTGLSAPTGVAVDSYGNVYVADTGNNRVVRINAGGGQQTLAFSGLSSPSGLALDGSGNLYVADRGNSRVVELGQNTSQTTINLGTSTFAPSAVAVDAAGDLYVTDATNLQVLAYLSGSTSGNPILTGLTAPVGVAIDVNGSVYVADTGAAGAIALNRAKGNISFPVTNLGQSNPAPVTFTNTGNAPLIFNGTGYANNVTAPFTLATASSNGCLLGSANSIASASTCLITANFAPTVANTYTDTIIPTTNAANNANVTAVLSGLAVHLTPSTTTLVVTSPATSPYYYGQTLTVTATTTLSANVGVPLGSFLITVDGRQQPAIPFGSTSTSTTVLTASVTLTGLTVGAHSVSVNESFTAPPYLYASSPATLNFSVLKATTITAVSSVPSSSGSLVSTTFTATVTPVTGSGETGFINFYSGTSVGTGTLLNPVPIAIAANTGLASYVSSATIFPSYSFIAVYTGDSNFSGSTSAVLTPPGTFNLTTPNTVVNIPQGGNVTNTFVLTPYFSYSGTVTPSCSGLPKYATCYFQPVSQAVSGTAQQTFTIYIFTDTTTTSRNEFVSGKSAVVFAMLLSPGLLALMFARRKRLIGQRFYLSMFVALCLVGSSCLIGCTNAVQVPNPSAITPASSQSVTVTMADNNASPVSQSIKFTLNVCNVTVSTSCQTF